jgi:hypothetical protein
MKRLLGRAITTLIMVVASVVGSVSLAQPAAANDCVTYYNFNVGGQLAAQICDSNASGGQGQITFQSRGQYRGVPKYMSLQVCDLSGSGATNCRTDAGTYLYYAGPIQDPGGCLLFRVQMYDGNGNRIINAERTRCN